MATTTNDPETAVIHAEIPPRDDDKAMVGDLRTENRRLRKTIGVISILWVASLVVLAVILMTADKPAQPKTVLFGSEVYDDEYVRLLMEECLKDNNNNNNQDVPGNETESSSEGIKNSFDPWAVDGANSGFSSSSISAQELDYWANMPPPETWTPVFP